MISEAAKKVAWDTLQFHFWKKKSDYIREACLFLLLKLSKISQTFRGISSKQLQKNCQKFAADPKFQLNLTPRWELVITALNILGTCDSNDPGSEQFLHLVYVLDHWNTPATTISVIFLSDIGDHGRG